MEFSLFIKAPNKLVKELFIRLELASHIEQVAGSKQPMSNIKVSPRIKQVFGKRLPF